MNCNVYVNVSARKKEIYQSYIIFNQYGTVINSFIGKSFISDAKLIHNVITDTIKKVLNYCVGNDLKNIFINSPLEYTKEMIKRDSVLFHLLKDCNASLCYRYDGLNNLIRNACRSKDVDYYDKPYNDKIVINSLKSIEEVNTCTDEIIKLESTTGRERFELMTIFYELTNRYNEYSMHDIMKFAENYNIPNSIKGRKYLIKKFIENKLLNKSI